MARNRFSAVFNRDRRHGSILVFRAEIENLSGPKPWTGRPAPNSQASLATVISQLRAAYPDFDVLSVLAPTETIPVFQAVMQGERRVTVVCDPSTGHVLGLLPQTPRWLHTVQDLHETLLLRRTGRILNGVGAIILLLLSLTGLVVWWPGVRNWKRGFLVDPRRNWRRINFDLHSAAGFWTLPVAAWWAISGIYFAWPDHVQRYVNSVSPVVNARPPRVSVPPESSFPDLDLQALIQRAYALDPGTHWKGTQFPSSRRAPLEILMQRGNGLGREYEDVVYFDPYTGAYLTTWRYGVSQSVGDWFLWAQVPLHFGSYWGLGVKLLWAASGLVVPLLTITGLLKYWNRVLRRKWRHRYHVFNR